MLLSTTLRPDIRMNLQERAMPNAFAGTRDFAPETKAPEHPHKSDCRFAETVCPRKTPPNRAYLRGFGKSPVARECVVDLRGLELRARHAFFKTMVTSISGGIIRSPVLPPLPQEDNSPPG
jgi:hypothetical protein